MAMAALQMVWSITLTAYTLWFSVGNDPLRPWINWDWVHWNFSRIDVYSTAFTPQVVLTTYYVLWWMVPASSFIFTVFFIFGQEAVEEYKAWFAWLKRRVLKKTYNK